MNVDGIRFVSTPAARFVAATPKLWALVEAGIDRPTGSGECIEFYEPDVTHHGGAYRPFCSQQTGRSGGPYGRPPIQGFGDRRLLGS